MDDRFDELTARATNLMEEYSVPGLALGMIIGGVDQTSVLGVTSIENPLEVTEVTLFQIGSTTKTFTATVLAILAGEGRLSLDDRVKVHVPELVLADPDVAETITVRQLLNHTTGFAGDLFTNTGNGDDNTALYVELMRDLPQLIPPGTIAVYNNAAFVLAGRVIETLTGETYEQSVKRIVLDPTGLDNSLFDPAAVMLRRFAVGHTVHPDGKVVIASPWQLPRSAMAAGGLSSSIADQLRYARFQMGNGSSTNGTPVLSKEAMTEMQTPTAEFIDDRWIGLSWMISDLSGTRIVAHGGATNGQMSAFWMCPDRGLAFVSMTNGSTGRLLNNELSGYAQELFLGFEAVVVEPLPVDHPDEFAGRYYSEPNREVFEIRSEDGHLVFQEIDRGRSVEAFDRSAETVPSRVEFQASDRVILRGGDLNGSSGVFMRDSSGQVTHLRMSRLLMKEL